MKCNKHEQTYAACNYSRTAIVDPEAKNCEDNRTEGVYRGADKSLARPGRKQATATEDFDFHVSYV